MTDLGGFAGYAEIDINNRYRQFPNPNRKRHHTSGDEALAWFANLSSTPYPYFFLLEAFSVDPMYQTSMVTADEEGRLDYDNDFERYEFVEDNDDQDRRPDWRRKGWGPGDREIFPGWDENNDFISDFNQNDNEDSPNLIPDYEEPFLRYYADRPEFLYGLDMNHNGTIDRFENDEEADLPYRRDRQGYNVFGGAHLLPGVRLMLGRMDMRRLAAAERNEALYGILTLDRDFNRWGRVRLFQDLRQVRDHIADPVLLWRQRPNTRGGLYGVEDPPRSAQYRYRHVVVWLGAAAICRVASGAQGQVAVPPPTGWPDRVGIKRAARDSLVFGRDQQGRVPLERKRIDLDAALEERILAPSASACRDAGAPRTRRAADADTPLPAAAPEHGRGWRGIRNFRAVAKPHAAGRGGQLPRADHHGPTDQFLGLPRLPTDDDLGL